MVESVDDEGYPARVRGRISRARKRGAQAMTLAVSLTAVFMIFLIYVLNAALRVGNAEAVRAAWLGIIIMVTVNILSYLLYRSQGRVLDEAISELTELFDAQGGEEASEDP